MTDTPERLREHLKSMQDEYQIVYQTPFPKDVFIEVLEENIKEQVKRFLKDRSDYLSAQVQYQIIELLKNPPKETVLKDADEQGGEENRKEYTRGKQGKKLKVG